MESKIYAHCTPLEVQTDGVTTLALWVMWRHQSCDHWILKV